MTTSGTVEATICKRIEAARAEARRFLDKSKEALEAFNSGKGDAFRCNEYAAAKRASLDLTKALSIMRRSGWH